MSIVFRNYDQASLDAQYNLRPLVPNHEVIFERYIRDSQATCDNYPCELDIAYGEQAGERLDVFKALHTDKPAPVLTFIHGGYWRNKDKSDYRYIAPGFAAMGIHCVVVNYTLAPHASMDEIVRQNRAALVWLWRNIERYGGDPERLFVSGHSAGGHMVGMMMATDWPAFSNNSAPANILKGGTAISGLFDLEPIRLCYLNETLGMSKDEARRNSPIHLSPGSDAPLILALGGDETDEYHRQQNEFEQNWREKGCRIDAVDMPALNHYDVIDHLGMPGSKLFQTIVRQIGRYSATI